MAANGQYASSSRGSSLACRRSDLTPISFDQFDLTLNRPDEVLKQIGVASPEEIGYFEQLSTRRRKMVMSEPSAADVMEPEARP
jgi:hypothetical protein